MQELEARSPCVVLQPDGSVRPFTVQKTRFWCIAFSNELQTYILQQINKDSNTSSF